MKNRNIPPELQHPPKLPKPQIDVSQLQDIRCENPKCGNVTFQEVVLLKRVPAFMTNENKDGVVPIPVFACNACGFVNNMFIPSFMRAETPKADPNDVQTPSSSQPKIEIVK